MKIQSLSLRKQNQNSHLTNLKIILKKKINWEIGDNRKVRKRIQMIKKMNYAYRKKIQKSKINTIKHARNFN